MKVSVIIPVYNKAKYLNTLFNCLISQTFTEFECIFVDDGSTDESGALCDAFSVNDKRFRIIHTLNSGVSHARNVGIHESHGKYITFIDADDRVPDNYLECLYQSINENCADLSICVITKIWDSGEKQRIELPGRGVLSKVNLLPDFADFQKRTGIYGYCCGKMITRELIGDTGFDEKIRLAEDFDFYLKLYPRMNSICFTDQTEYFYLQESENSSMLVTDDAIDYRAQLSINIHYKHFLEKENVYSGNNQIVVSQLLSNYVFFSLFYCSIDKLKDCFCELRSICENEGITMCGRNVFEKWVLLLLYENNYYLLKKSLQCYRFMRSLLRRR